MKRLFAAVRIQAGPVFRSELSRLQQTMSRERIKWVNPDQVHVTLKFFGETGEDMIPDICNALEKACAGTGRIELKIQNAGIFGSRYNPRVIWLGMEEGGKLKELYIKIQENLRPLGYEPDNQNFVPHLTLGRVKEIRDKAYFQKIMEGLKQVYIQNSLIDSCHLFESKLHSYGPEYSVIRTFPL